MHRIKRIAIALLVSAVFGCCTVTAYAEEDTSETIDTELTTTVTATSGESSTEEETTSTAENENSDSDTLSSAATSSGDSSSLVDSATASSSNSDSDKLSDTDTTLIPDYFGDDSFDTAGNLSLIKEQKIIYDSSEMQFIAVTTKGGNVFYILIDYTAVKNAEDGEDGANAQGTVYFLNKVDDYDLYSLLYEDSDSIPKYDNANISRSEIPTENEDENVDSSEEGTENNSFLAKNSSLLLMLGVGGIGVAAYYFLKIKPQKAQKALIEEDDDDEIEFADEEINEDEENNPIELQKYSEQNGPEQPQDSGIYGSPEDDEDIL